ncbi:MAG: hypothetical protein M3142_14645, partial [Bacteroidota bacterium]|nr:hypothetical protein [Bacteroidota bacterium]
VSVPSSEVLKYNGKPLAYFIDENFEKDGIVRVFTSEEKANTYRSQIDSKDKNSAARTGAAMSRPRIWVYLNNNYGGASQDFYLGNSNLYNLNTIQSGVWNNSISSIKCKEMDRWTVLFDKKGYEGDNVSIQRGTNRPNLNSLNKVFNNKASSIKFIR